MASLRRAMTPLAEGPSPMRKWRGARITLEATGRDAEKALLRLAALLVEFKAQEEAQRQG